MRVTNKQGVLPKVTITFTQIQTNHAKQFERLYTILYTATAPPDYKRGDRCCLKILSIFKVERHYVLFKCQYDRK